jgi:hypothetical protein
LKVASRAATLLFRTSLANRQPAPALQTTKTPALGAFVSSAIEPVPSLLVTSAAASAAAAEVVAALHAGLVLIGRCMAGSSYMALPVARLVSLEVQEGLRAAFRQRPVVPIARIITVVDVAIKAALSRGTTDPLQ